MGKRIIQQRRGRGTMTYRAHSHRHKGKIVYSPVGKDVRKVGKIIDIIHCPGHSAPLAKIQYEDKSFALIAAPGAIYAGQEVQSGVEAEIKAGNSLPLKSIPEGTEISNIESTPGKVAFCKAAGSFARVVAKYPEKIVVKFPSKKQKDFHPECRATIGIIAGGGRKEKPLVKAGKAWHLMHAKGKLYPKTSGVAMNAVDHPFGSGRGRHVGKSKIPTRNAPPGRNIGLLRAKRTGRKR